MNQNKTSLLSYRVALGEIAVVLPKITPINQAGREGLMRQHVFGSRQAHAIADITEQSLKGVQDIVQERLEDPARKGLFRKHVFSSRAAVGLRAAAPQELQDAEYHQRRQALRSLGESESRMAVSDLVMLPQTSRRPRQPLNSTTASDLPRFAQLADHPVVDPAPAIGRMNAGAVMERFFQPDPPKTIPKTMTLREQLLQAYKFLVPQELLTLHRYPEAVDDAHWSQTKEAIAGIWKHIGAHCEHVALPFPLVFVETAGGGMLVRELEGFEQRRWEVQLVRETTDADGVLQAERYPRVYHLLPQQREEDGEVRWEFALRYPDVSVSQLNPEHHRVGLLMCAELMQILLLINTKNRKPVKYAPQPEVEKLPTLFQPYYTYHLLSLVRSVELPPSLEDWVQTQRRQQRQPVERRAGWVRSHYKTCKTGVFLWEKFLRNKRNAHKGIVDKDYVVKVKKPQA